MVHQYIPSNQLKHLTNHWGQAYRVTVPWLSSSGSGLPGPATRYLVAHQCHLTYGSIWGDEVKLLNSALLTFVDEYHLVLGNLLPLVPQFLLDNEPGDVYVSQLFPSIVDRQLRYGASILSTEYSCKKDIKNLCLSLVLTLKWAQDAAEVTYPYLHLQLVICLQKAFELVFRFETSWASISFLSCWVKPLSLFLWSWYLATGQLHWISRNLTGRQECMLLLI